MYMYDTSAYVILQGLRARRYGWKGSCGMTDGLQHWRQKRARHLSHNAETYSLGHTRLGVTGATTASGRLHIGSHALHFGSATCCDVGRPTLRQTRRTGGGEVVNRTTLTWGSRGECCPITGTPLAAGPLLPGLKVQHAGRSVHVQVRSM